MKHDQGIGQWGEAKAVEDLTQRGYERGVWNIRTPYGEIDMVAKQNARSMLVAAKIRTSNTRGLPEESITPRRRAHLLAAADPAAAEHEIKARQIEVTAIEGIPGSKPKRFDFENAI